MPFKSTNDLRDNADVKIFLSGLMIIQPNADSTACEVFVNRAALDHHFSIEVREKKANRPDGVVMRHLGPLEFQNLADSEHGVILLADKPKGMEMYIGPAKPGGEETLALAVDLASGKFQQPKGLTVDRKGGTPSIFLNDGTFYTAMKSPEGVKVTLKKGGNEEVLPPIANLIAANIYLDPNEKLSLRWREMGIPNVLELKKRDDGVTYEVYILNEPLYVDAETGETHDEFQEYYKILSEVPDKEKLRLDVEVSAEETDKGTPHTLCMSVILNT